MVKEEAASQAKEARDRARAQAMQVGGLPLLETRVEEDAPIILRRSKAGLMLHVAQNKYFIFRTDNWNI